MPETRAAKIQQNGQDSKFPGKSDRSAVGARVAVRKTYKLFIGGAFPRSESGRSYPVTSTTGEFLANAAWASRKDVRDAVRAARAAQPGWAGATAYNRGQILYRVAEMLEGRRAQFVDEVRLAEGLKRTAAEEVVDAAIDRWVWYAGWSDKVAQVYGAANPVAGPFFNLTTPEPTGVVGIVAPADSSLLGLVSVVAPVIVTGNTVVVLASEPRPLPAISLAEVLANSDLPGGVVNMLTGPAAETAPWLAAHLDVNALDLTGVTSPELATSLEAAAAGNLKRVLRPSRGEGSVAARNERGADRPSFIQAEDAVDWAADPGVRRLTAFLEAKTVWHPKGV